MGQDIAGEPAAAIQRPLEGADDLPAARAIPSTGATDADDPTMQMWIGRSLGVLAQNQAERALGRVQARRWRDTASRLRGDRGRGLMRNVKPRYGLATVWWLFWTPWAMLMGFVIFQLLWSILHG